MGNDQNAALFSENFFFYELDNHFPGIAIQRGGGFVENQNLRAADDRARDGHSLLLSSGKFYGQDIAPAFQANNIEVFSCFGDGLVPVPLLKDQRDGDILSRGQSRKKVIVLKHKPDCIQAEIGQLVVVHRPDIRAIDGHLAFAWAQDSGDHAERRGLSTSGGADNEQHFAKVGDKSDMIYGCYLGLAFTKPLG